MRDLSIYIHIPFCVKKCLYCDFLSRPACGGEMESYVNLLLREIKEQSVFYGDHRVVSIFLFSRRGTRDGFWNRSGTAFLWRRTLRLPSSAIPVR